MRPKRACAPPSVRARAIRDCRHAFIKPHTYLTTAAQGCPTSHSRVSLIRRVIRVASRWVGAPPAEGGNADLIRPLSCAIEAVALQTHPACAPLMLESSVASNGAGTSRKAWAWLSPLGNPRYGGGSTERGAVE
jgi:hypothetical protein